MTSEVRTTLRHPHAEGHCVRWLALVVLLITVASDVTDTSREPDRGVVITSPRDGVPVAGPTAIEFALSPEETVGALDEATVFVDGRVVCRLSEPPFSCAWNAGRDIAPHLVRVVARWRGGGRSVATARTGALALGERVDVEAVQLTIVVEEPRGGFVRGLPREAFTVYHDDRPQVLAHFAAEQVPLEVVVAIDMSGSMAEAMPAVREAAGRFLDALGPEHQVTVVAFNDNVFTLSRRGASVDSRRRALARLAPWGGTALYDAILSGIDLLGTEQGRRALVVFTDGADRQSHASRDEVRRRIEASDATVFAIGQGEATTNPALRRLLDELTAVSGGRAFIESRGEALDAVFARIVEELSSQYFVSYQPHEMVPDGRWHRIRVEVDRPGVRVRTRQGVRSLAAVSGH